MKQLLTTLTVILSFYGNINAQSNFIISRGDVLDIMVMEHPEFSISNITVLPDGTIQYPGLGSIVAAGMTSVQLKDTMTTALNRFLVNPIVTVFVKKIYGETINVFGYVNKPGQYMLFQPTDIFDVIGMAGGIKSMKKARKIVIIRADRTTQDVRIKDYFNNSPHSQVIYIYPGDTLYIKEPKEVNWSMITFFSTLLYATTNIIRLL
ncbi:MAG: polysaccharide biosynthesis/export family protein [Bacteroidales bacterium]|nr:polysaccharide biosynthesis/export family protein [Bacteroidales bacterium]